MRSAVLPQWLMANPTAPGMVHTDDTGSQSFFDLITSKPLKAGLSLKGKPVVAETDEWPGFNPFDESSAICLRGAEFHLESEDVDEQKLDVTLFTEARSALGTYNPTFLATWEISDLGLAVMLVDNAPIRAFSREFDTVTLSPLDTDEADYVEDLFRYGMSGLTDRRKDIGQRKEQDRLAGTPT